MRVLVIPEDFRKDQYLLKPLFERVFADIERQNTKVVVCNAPLLRKRPVITALLCSGRVW
jgi:hypothetical protein